VREILQDFQEKIKQVLRNDQTYVTLLIVCVGGISFALGALSVENPYESKGIVTIQATTTPEKATIDLAATAGQQALSAVDTSKNAAFAGSKTGTVYYPIGCSSVARIKMENRVLFATVAEAEGAGRVRSSQCR
jgi:hypothetical protein